MCGAPASVAFRAVLGLALACGLVACSEGNAASTTYDDPALRLEGSLPTLNALGERVLTGLTREDGPGLEALRLTEREHNEVVWPELPVSAPEVNFPVDFAWSNIEGRNRSALRRLLPLFGAQALVFRSVQCRGETQSFDTFEVLTDCWLVFTRGERAELWQVQAFEEVLVRGGGHKIFRYYDEEPRRYSPQEHAGGPSASPR